MEIRTIVQDLPDDHTGPDPSSGEVIEIHLPRCRECGKILNQPKRRFCNTRHKQRWKDQRRKLKTA